MIQSFSNGATRAVFEFIANRPDIYEKVSELVRNNPAKSPEEIKSFTQEYIKLSSSALGDSLVSDLLEAAFKEVKFSEIRQQLQFENR